MILMNFFTWYFELFSNQDNKVRIAAWAATIATLTFIITFIVKPSRVWVINKFKKNPEILLSTFSDIVIKYSFDELKAKLKLIVIDDDDIFPVEGFKQFGYNINKWDKLNEQKLKSLHDGDYDIIILDIWGVAKDIAENDGLDVLKDLKTYNPAQVVVAYSGHSFDLSKNVFWEIADEKLSKPTLFIGTQKLIDNLIERAFTIEYFQEKIKTVLNENNLLSEFDNIADLFVRFKSLNSEPNWTNELNIIMAKNGEKQKLASILSRLFKYSALKSN